MMRTRLLQVLKFGEWHKSTLFFFFSNIILEAGAGNWVVEAMAWLTISEEVPVNSLSVYRFVLKTT